MMDVSRIPAVSERKRTADVNSLSGAKVKKPAT